MMKLNCGASLVAIAALSATPAFAQDATQPAAEERVGGIGEIVVTARKVGENLQDVPIAVSAIGEEALDELAIDTFSDYLDQLPSVSAGGSGPGQSTIYIRGLASTTPNLTTAGVAGLAPNVALYLDEQPLSQPGRNLDVYAADMQRIEVLAGPQGTLFGASSQAGVVRLITNKPSLGGFEAKFKGGVSTTKGGEENYNLEAMVNIPVADNVAVRAVVYHDHQGGYIDNVAGTQTLRDSARFRPAGTVRSNGVAVNALRGGFQSDAATLAQIDANVTFLAADNAALVEDNFNDTQYTGFRLSGLVELSPDWTITVSHAQQGIDSDGVFFADPALDIDDLEIQRYEDDNISDDFSNTSWTVEGRVAMLDIVYTGAFTSRKTEQRVDYTDYLFVGQYLPYYICDGSVSYPGAGGPTGTCQAPNLFVTSNSNTDVFTQEFRVSTPQDERIRGTFGAFYSDLTLEERNDFTYPGSVAAAPFGAFAPNTPFPGGFQSVEGAFPAGVIFRNDIRRTDEQFGLFGEASLDIVPDLLTLTVGARYYNIEVDFEGDANASFCNSGAAQDADAFGTNISDLYDGDGQFTFISSCNAALRQTFNAGDTIADIQAAGLSATQAQQVFNALAAPDVAKAEGWIKKGTLTFTPNRDLLFYATYSEGFRPGLLNRPGGATNGAGFTVPFELETDEVKNYEFGWKLDLLDRQLRFNGSAFYVDISRLQTTIFDPSITNLFFSDNAANAEIKGIEGEITIAPYSIQGLTVSGAFSILDTEITEVLTPTTDVTVGSPLAYAPEFQGNMRARYEWSVGDYTAHIMPQMAYSSSKFTDIISINSFELDSYTTFGLSAGIQSDKWSIELFGENLSDERAEIAGNFINDRERITTNRPRTIGVRVGFNY